MKGFDQPGNVGQKVSHSHTCSQCSFPFHHPHCDSHCLCRLFFELPCPPSVASLGAGRPGILCGHNYMTIAQGRGAVLPNMEIRNPCIHEMHPGTAATVPVYTRPTHLPHTAAPATQEPPAADTAHTRLQPYDKSGCSQQCRVPSVSNFSSTAKHNACAVTAPQPATHTGSRRPHPQHAQHHMTAANWAAQPGCWPAALATAQINCNSTDQLT